MGGIMKVNTSRFGTLEVQEADIMQIPDGLLGFEDLKQFFIVDPADETLILWLQSSTNPEVAFPILEPKVFKPDYKVHLSANELRSLKIESLKEKGILVYCILTIPDDITKMTANLKAPLVINASAQMGRQVVLQENEYNVRASIYRELLTLIMSMTAHTKKMGQPELSDDTAAAPMSLRSASSKVEVVAL
jgi:flagellar assembly factor FliW